MMESSLFGIGQLCVRLIASARARQKPQIHIATLGATLGLICGCHSSAPKGSQGTAGRPTVVTAHAAAADLPTFGVPTERSIHVMVGGYGVERPGYYFLPRGSTVHDAFEAARGTDRADWRRPYSGIGRPKPDGSREQIWFARKTRASDEKLELQDGDEVRFSHEVY